LAPEVGSNGVPYAAKPIGAGLGTGSAARDGLIFNAVSPMVVAGQHNQGIRMKKFLTEHPYAITSAIFLALMVFGLTYLSWRKDDFMFMLLLYFIVTLGIRLDDICRQLGSATQSNENVLSALQDIRSALKETNQRLHAIQDNLGQPPPEA
jgi:hypothetical protein